MVKRSKHLRIWLAVIAVAIVAGCSTLPTAPVVDRVSTSGATASRSTASPELLGLLDPSVTELSATSVSSAKVVNGLLGGVVQAGDFKLIIPPLAIRGTATVTVTQPDVSSPVVELSISPASANRFYLPVLLVADASRLSPALISVSYISWFNPATGLWERVPGCSVSVVNLTITAPLSHFSTYRVERGGKAGW